MTDPDDILVRRRDVLHANDHDGVRVRFLFFAGAGHRGFVFTRTVALERTLPFGGWDRDDEDVMDYIYQSEYLNSRRFSVFLVNDRVIRVTVDGQSQMKFYRAWSKRMEQ